ncbi:SEC-C metal-binding domain-containing protein [Kutzneria sp. NPDC051319]|uniref:SEC-C metal-binding domain-containing protein n=1 Tax=Kutzneria sp. NPDC051319 TaxID=3155047 RepID=UPI0034255FFB
MEKLGGNDPCPCGSGRRFQALLPPPRPLRRHPRPLLHPRLTPHPPHPPDATCGAHVALGVECGAHMWRSKVGTGAVGVARQGVRPAS